MSSTLCDEQLQNDEPYTFLTKFSAAVSDKSCWQQTCNEKYIFHHTCQCIGNVLESDYAAMSSSYSCVLSVKMKAHDDSGIVDENK